MRNGDILRKMEKNSLIIRTKLEHIMRIVGFENMTLGGHSESQIIR